MRVCLISTLSDDCLFHIFSFLEPRDLGRVASVSKLWNSLSAEDELWRRLTLDFLGTSELDPVHAPKAGEWKKHFIFSCWSRSFDTERHHPLITIVPKKKMATVPSDCTDNNYKGCMVTPAIPMCGRSRFKFHCKFLDESSSDHVAIGVANSQFNTKKFCPEGWTDSNAGWYAVSLWVVFVRCVT